MCFCITNLNQEVKNFWIQISSSLPKVKSYVIVSAKANRVTHLTSCY